MEQFFRLYGPNCWGTFTSNDGVTDFDYQETGIYFCKDFSCQRIHHESTLNLQHLHSVHGNKWESWGDMNPFWRILKINLKANNEVSWNALKFRKSAYMSLVNCYMNIGDITLPNSIIGDVSLDPTDSDFTHLTMRPRPKFKGIEVHEIISKNKEPQPRIIFSRNERRSKTPERKEKEWWSHEDSDSEIRSKRTRNSRIDTETSSDEERMTKYKTKMPKKGK
jgi:hypothetical protein